MIAVIVTCYNYARYLGDALSSIAAQTRAADRVVIVDDGSSDDTAAVARSFVERMSGWQYVYQENRGQLAAFNRGLAECAGAQHVFLLDADDVYHRSHIDACLRTLQQCAFDFAFSGFSQFNGQYDGSAPLAAEGVEKCWGSSALSTWHAGTAIGAPTSTLYLSGDLAERLRPLPHESEWKICADNVLVIGSSLLGARKVQLKQNTVGYRIHGQNAFYQQPRDALQDVRRHRALARLYQHYATLIGLDHASFATQDPPFTAEFRTITPASVKDALLYAKLNLLKRDSLKLRLVGAFSTMREYARVRLGDP